MPDKTQPPSAELFTKELNALLVKYPTVKLTITHNVQVQEEFPFAPKVEQTVV